MECTILKQYIVIASIILALCLVTVACSSNPDPTVTTSPPTSTPAPPTSTPAPSITPSPIPPSPTSTPLGGGSGQIAFVSDRDRVNGNEIYVMNADGSNPINLSNNPAKEDHPSWSPDGKLIVFDSDRDGNTEIYVMNADGSNPTNVTNNSGYDNLPSWSAK
jgi:dipeptidyl aminopeptidase/acylaminoacyl peptidase